MKLPKQEGNFYDSDSSRMLALMRWPLALCIVAEHWFGSSRGYGDKYFEGLPLPIFDDVLKFVRVFIEGIGVGSFFFISGFLFFAGGVMTRERWKQKLRKRVDTLLIPYILWNTMFVLYMMLHYMPSFGWLFPGAAEGGYEMSWGLYFQGLFLTPYPHDAALWFLRELMTCVLLVPILQPMLKRVPWLVLGVSGIGFLIFESCELIYCRNLCEALFFFSLGGVTCFKEVDLEAIARDRIWLMGTICVSLGAAFWLTSEITKWSNVLKFVSVPITLWFGLTIASRLVRKGWRANTFLTASTFFVYAAHLFVIPHFLSSMIKICKPQSDVAIALMVMAGYVLLMAFLLGVYWVLRRYLPGVTGILTGRRNTGQASRSTKTENTTA